ncbi:hypothetical protein CXB51_018366 [Gossypium anomalum]|uniref:Molybdate transporter 1-like n=1 Tax=Gossypium anomalum TaxID=47600 RepID=A0A8J5Z347_9ROSI|nr:hypothetical protein CXB51_018366 [Gossypium anomalum]
MESQNPQTSENLDSNPTSLSLDNLVHKVKSNLVFRSKWADLNGAMGDLGTYIPIVLALTLAKDLNLGTTLIFTGVYNMLTGAIYGIPLPVQPMKSIAAVAISDGPDFNIPEVMASGICTGAILGIQLSQGLAFTMTAIKHIRKVQDFSKSKSKENRHWVGLDGLILAIVCACFIIVINGAGKERNERETSNVDDEERNMRSKRIKKTMANIPSAFIVFFLGVVLAFIRKPAVVKDIKFGPSSMEVVEFTSHAWKQGFIKGTIPQLQLSILNSVIAVCKLSSDLFPGKELSATSVSITVGLMNLVGCWFGAIPCCHGAGGLAGQYKFGGRSGGCVAILGAAELVLGLVLGISLVRILDWFPVGILGVLLLFAGIELAMTCRDTNSKGECFVLLICTAVSLVGSSAALGFVCGMVVHLLLNLRL